MRTLISLIEQIELDESSGGLIRRGQEVAQGKVVTFANGNRRINLVTTIVIPANGVKFQSREELEAGIESTLMQSKNPTVLYQNAIKNSSGAALITLWEDEAGTPLAFIKVTDSKSAGNIPITWTNADFGSVTGFKQADNKIAERAQFKLKPTDLFPTDVYVPVGKLISLMKPRSDLSPEVNTQIRQLLNNVLINSDTPVKGADQYITTYEVDLGESAAPIALSTGNFVTGNYKEAEDALLKPLGLTWANVTEVLFPGSGSEHLYDSYLRMSKTDTLKVSSKDKKGGAAAAVTGLISDIEKNPERFADVTSDKRYAKIIKVLKIISSQSAKEGPLNLAISFGMITQMDADQILAHAGQGEKYSPNERWARTPGLKAAFARKGAKFADAAYDMGYHALAGVAELIADKLNDMPGMSDFFKAVLASSTMIQVKTTMSKGADGASFSKFQIIYPPAFSGNIEVIANNNYMATRRPIGKISFKIPSGPTINAADTKKSNTSDRPAANKPSVVTGKRNPIKPTVKYKSKGASTSEPRGLSVSKGLGRERRK